MHFAFLGKQVLMWKQFYVREGFFSLFLCLFIQGISLISNRKKCFQTTSDVFGKGINGVTSTQELFKL